MAAYARKIAQNWMIRPVQFVVIQNKKIMATKKKRSVFNFLTSILELMFKAQMVQKIEPGQYQKLDPVSIQITGLAK